MRTSCASCNALNFRALITRLIRRVTQVHSYLCCRQIRRKLVYVSRIRSRWVFGVPARSDKFLHGLVAMLVHLDSTAVPVSELHNPSVCTSCQPQVFEQVTNEYESACFMHFTCPSQAGSHMAIAAIGVDACNILLSGQAPRPPCKPVRWHLAMSEASCKMFNSCHLQLISHDCFKHVLTSLFARCQLSTIADIRAQPSLGSRLLRTVLVALRQQASCMGGSE